MTDGLIIIPELLFDGTPTPVRRNTAVVVADEYIFDVVPTNNLPHESSMQTVYLPDSTLLPGIIDAHVHLTFDGVEPLETMVRESNEMLALRAASQAREAVLAGITTMRDCGGRDDVMFILRESIQSGLTLGPRLVLSGRPLTSRRGHCYFMNGEVDGREAMTELIADLAEKGADFIKVMATGGDLTPGTNPLAMQFSREDLAFIVREATHRGLQVAAHAHSLEGSKAAVEAGVAVVEHATFMDETGISMDHSLVKRMAEQKTVVIPTSIPLINAARAGLTLRLARKLGVSMAEFLALREAAVRDLITGGVRLIAGSDAGATCTRFTDIFGEIESLAQAGMTNIQAIAAATGDAAAALGLSQIGRIRPQFLADLVAVRGDVTKDLQALRHITFVMLGGRIVREETPQSGFL